MIEKIDFDIIVQNKFDISVYSWNDDGYGDVFDTMIQNESDMTRFLVRREHFENRDLLFLQITASGIYLYFSQDDYFYRATNNNWGEDEYRQYRSLLLQGMSPIDAMGFVNL